MRFARWTSPGSLTPWKSTKSLSSSPLRPGAPGRVLSRRIQLPVKEGMGDRAFGLGPSGDLFVVDHSEVSGRTAEPARAFIDLHIGDLDAQQSRLEVAGCEVHPEQGRGVLGGVISTIEDPDGNRIQLMEYHPELARRRGEAVTA